MGFATGGYRIRPYDFTVIFGTKIITHYELRIDLIPHSEFLIPNFIYSCSFPLQKQSMYLSMQRSMIFTASSLPFTSSMTVSLPSRDL